MYRVFDQALTQGQVTTLQGDGIYLPSASPTPLPSASPTALPTTPPSASPTHEPTLWRGSLDSDVLDNTVTYLVATSSGVNEGFVTSGDGIVSGVSEVDDSPMYHVKQHFTFPFGGVRYRHIWINANGGIFFTPNPPCSAYYSTGASCDFDTVRHAPYIYTYVINMCSLSTCRSLQRGWRPG